MNSGFDTMPKSIKPRKEEAMFFINFEYDASACQADLQNADFRKRIEDQYKVTIIVVPPEHQARSEKTVPPTDMYILSIGENGWAKPNDGSIELAPRRIRSALFASADVNRLKQILTDIFGNNIRFLKHTFQEVDFS